MEENLDEEDSKIDQSDTDERTEVKEKVQLLRMIEKLMRWTVI